MREGEPTIEWLPGNMGVIRGGTYHGRVVRLEYEEYDLGAQCMASILLNNGWSLLKTNRCGGSEVDELLDLARAVGTIIGLTGE